MNVVISIDKNYLDKAETMLFSLRKNMREADICVYLLYNSLAEKDIKKLISYCKRKCKICVRPIKVDESRFVSMSVGAYFSIETYFRLLAQFLLPDEVERALYLDADMVILKDISEFYSQPLGDKYFVACYDFSAWSAGMQDYQKNVLRLPESHVYFNAGVLLMNVKALRENTTADNILSVANGLSGKLSYYDQDVLNILYTGKVIYTDKKYNYQKPNRVIKKGDEALKDDIAILHYVGYYKPWKWRSMDGLSKYYWHTRFKQGHVFETAAAYIFSPFARLALKIKTKLVKNK